MKYLAGAVVNTPVAISGSSGVQSMLTIQLLLNDPSCRAGELKTSCPMGTGRLKNLALINRAMGFNNPATRR